jgi:hypothetical protein
MVYFKSCRVDEVAASFVLYYSSLSPTSKLFLAVEIVYSYNMNKNIFEFLWLGGGGGRPQCRTSTGELRWIRGRATKNTCFHLISPVLSFYIVIFFLATITVSNP